MLCSYSHLATLGKAMDKDDACFRSCFDTLLILSAKTLGFSEIALLRQGSTKLESSTQSMRFLVGYGTGDTWTTLEFFVRHLLELCFTWRFTVFLLLSLRRPPCPKFRTTNTKRGHACFLGKSYTSQLHILPSVITAFLPAYTSRYSTCSSSLFSS